MPSGIHSNNRLIHQYILANINGILFPDRCDWIFLPIVHLEKGRQQYFPRKRYSDKIGVVSSVCTMGGWISKKTKPVISRIIVSKCGYFRSYRERLVHRYAVPGR